MADEYVTEPVKLRIKRKPDVKLKNEHIFPNSNQTEPLVSGEMLFSTASAVQTAWTNLYATKTSP